MSKYWLTVIFLIAFLFSACQPQPPSMNTPSPYPSGDSPTPNDEPYPPAETITEEQAVKNVLKKASEMLDLPEENLEIQDMEKREWANACLELPQPDEACAEMIVSGYRIQLLANGQTIVIHTNHDGTNVRFAEEIPMGDISEKVKSYILQNFNVNESQINILQIQDVEWPDSCLGISQPDQMCLQVITPGYRIIVEVQGKKIILHANRDGSRILQAKR